MNTHALTFTLTRPKVWIPALFGFGLLLGQVSVFWGLGFLAFSVLQASKLYSNDRLQILLRLKAEKRKHGITRLLNDQERQEIITLDRYASSLQARGADPQLARTTMEEAWEIIRKANNI